MAEGRAFIGRFPDRGILASGGFGTVHLSHDDALGRDLALKVLASNLAADPDIRRRFVREARDLASLRHPNIVTVHELGETASGPFYAMELIRGQTLDTLLKTTGPLSLAQVAGIFAPLGAAVDYIHRRGIVHRDIKTANVMLDDEGRVVLMDFGIARAAEGTQYTATGMAIGTTEAMAPEQILGEHVGPPADIYALGVLAYKLLAGRPPFQGSRKQVEDGHLYEPPPPLRGLCPGLPENVYAVIQQALAKEPAARPGSAQTLAAALTAALPGDAAKPAVADPPPLIPSALPHYVPETVVSTTQSTSVLPRPATTPVKILAAAVAPQYGLPTNPAGSGGTFPVPRPDSPIPYDRWKLFGARLVAAVIDSIIGCMFFLITVTFGNSVLHNNWVVGVWLGLALWFPYCWWGNACGGSLGKRAMDILVANEHTGRLIGWRAGLIRTLWSFMILPIVFLAIWNFKGFVIVLLVVVLLGFFWSLWNKQR